MVKALRPFAVLACLSVALAFGPLTRAQTPAAPAPRGPITLTGPLTVAAVGDSIALRPLSIYEKQPAFAGVRDLIQSADVGFTNFEFTVFDLHKFLPTPQAENGGLAVYAGPEQAKQLQWMGFNMVSRANNHATDLGVEGMEETDQILDSIGMVHAGTGQTLGDARAPAYLQTARGRIALISTASTFTPMSRAGAARFDMKGRPGVNALRTTRTVWLEPAAYDALKAAVANMHLQPAPKPFTDTEMRAFGDHFKKGTTNRIEIDADQNDVQDILAQVRSARREADFVYVVIHAHEPSNQSETPPDFLPGFAHAAIDAGADMFITHGPHQLRGVEIYKGKPIFYSLGNFIFQYQTLDRLSADDYEKDGLDMYRSTVGDFFDDVIRNKKGLGFTEDVWWESAVAVVKFDHDRLQSIEMHPIDLGADRPPSQRGTPRLASPALAKKIVDRLIRLSAPFGTHMRDLNGVAVVDLGTTATQQH